MNRKNSTFIKLKRAKVRETVAFLCAGQPLNPAIVKKYLELLGIELDWDQVEKRIEFYKGELDNELQDKGHNNFSFKE